MWIFGKESFAVRLHCKICTFWGINICGLIKSFFFSSFKGNRCAQFHAFLILWTFFTSSSTDCEIQKNNPMGCFVQIITKICMLKTGWIFCRKGILRLTDIRIFLRNKPLRVVSKAQKFEKFFAQTPSSLLK